MANVQYINQNYITKMDSSCEWTHMIGMRRIAMKGFDSVAVCSHSRCRCWNETFLIAALSLDWTVRNEMYTDINENSCIPRHNQSIKINIIFHFYTQNNNFHEISSEPWICAEFRLYNQMKLNKRWFDFQYVPFILFASNAHSIPNCNLFNHFPV